MQPASSDIADLDGGLPSQFMLHHDIPGPGLRYRPSGILRRDVQREISGPATGGIVGLSIGDGNHGLQRRIPAEENGVADTWPRHEAADPATDDSLWAY